MALTQRPKLRGHRNGPADAPPRDGPPRARGPEPDAPRLDGQRTDGGPTTPQPETPRQTRAPVPTTAQAAVPGADRDVAGTGVAQARGARLLATDARVAFVLINYARLRAVARLFGASPEQANLVTAIALLTLAETARRKIRRLMEGPPVPSLGDSLLGGAVVRELVGGVAGLSEREGAQPTTLLMLAVASGLAGPTAVKSIRGVKSASHRVWASSHRADLAFHHRYGYLIDPGHWRARHAERASRRDADAAARGG